MPKVCHILITITRQFSLAPPSLFSLPCSFNFLPGCLHHRSAVSGASRGLGGTVAQLCSQHPPTDVTSWATVGEVERRGPFLPLPLFAPTMIMSKWDEEKAFLFRFRLFQMYYHCTTWLPHRSEFNSQSPPTDSILSSILISTFFFFFSFFLLRLSWYEL